MKTDRFIKFVFWSLLAVFVLILCQMIIPAVRDIFRGSMLFLVPFGIFFLLGALLAFLAARWKEKGKTRNWLLLTGISAAGVFASILLHNFIYGLAIYIFGHEAWGGAGDEPAFFLLGLVVFPLLFMVGAVASAIQLLKRRK